MNYLTFFRCFIALIVSLWCCTISEAQNAPDARISSAFDAQTIQQMSAPQLAQWTYELDNGWFLTELPKEKGNLSDYPTIQLTDSQNINIVFLLKNKIVHRHKTKLNSYHIAGTQQLLVLRSQDDVGAENNALRH